jgi:DNA gyrase subunit A
VYIVKGDDVASISRCPKEQKDENETEEGSETLILE